MIIKYYYEGWNYIDNATDVKWVNKLSGDLILNANKRWEKEKYTDNVGDSVEDQIYYKIFDQIKFEAETINGEESVRYSKIAIETSFIIKNMYETFGGYIRVLFYTENDIRHMLVFNNSGFLMNDNGKTIEKIG